MSVTDLNLGKVKGFLTVFRIVDIFMKPHSILLGFFEDKLYLIYWTHNILRFF